MTREELLVERITYITKIALGEELNNMLGIEVDKDFNEAILQASIKAAKVGMKFADSHPHWISVEDEYPPFDAKENGTWRCSKDVLIFAPFRGIFVGRYECDDMYGKTYWLFNGGSYPTVERGDGYESSNVTHWMPLPEEPKKGGEK